MKTILCAVLVVGLSFLAPALGQDAASELIGIWKVKDGRDQDFYITLNADGTAKSEWVQAQNTSRNQTGTWTAMDTDAHVTWANGWREVISKGESGFTKKAYSPQQSLEDSPINSSPAVKVDAVPAVE